MCFDGIMIRCPFDLRALERAVEKALSITIQLATKDMNEGFKLENVQRYEEPKPSTSFDFEDPYTYQTFQNEFKERQFDSWEEAHEVLGSIYPKVIGRVLRGDGSYIKKLDDGEIDLVRKLGASDFNIYISGLNHQNGSSVIISSSRMVLATMSVSSKHVNPQTSICGVDFRVKEQTKGPLGLNS